jgi:ABC-type uncharacterized transport system ATPase subunit
VFIELKDSGAAVVLSSHIIAELEKIADDFLILKKGEALLQENLRRFKTENFLVQMTHSRIEKPQFARAASFVRDRDLYSEMIVRKDRIAAFFPLIDRKHTPAFLRELDLEKIFLFFAR